MRKKQLKNVIVTSFATLICAISYGQEEKVSQKINGENGQPNLVIFNKNAGYSLKDVNKVLSEQLRINSEDSFYLIASEKDQIGYSHQKYQQQYNGVPVEFGTYTLHGQDNKLNSISGEYYDLKGTNTTPSISNTTGFQKAINHIGASRYLWQDANQSQQINYSQPEGELVLLPNLEKQGKSTSKNATLAYKYDIYATAPISRGMVYVDAVSGEILFYNSIIKHLDEHANSSKNLISESHSEHISAPKNFRATGNAATRYSGTKPITTRIVGSSYALRDNTRGGGINTYNSGRQASYPQTNFTDADNNWTAAEFNNINKDNAALDAHWGAEKTYDYLSSVHGRNSYNNNGAAINSWVHYDDQPGGAGYDNAFWNGSVMTYGDGSSNGNEGNGFFDALTSIDVAAHEIGHAVTSSSANLAYQRESGGLNEGFSDIWGAAVEHFAKGNGNDFAPSAITWLIGDEIDRRNGSSALRSMSNPTSRNQPDTYGGQFWQNPNCGTPTRANDYCGVHTNSGVLNYWFYLAVAGGNGTNDIGNAFSVSGIGMTKSSKIAYRTLTVYLSSNSTFANARAGAIQSAKDLYGAGGAEEIAVTNAWHAVGVGAAYPTGGGGSSSYCTSNGQNTNDEYISRVQLNTINNSSGAQSYSDFTSISTNLTKGSNYNVIVTPTWTGTKYNEGFAVWIDFNGDKDFDDSGELLGTVAPNQNTTSTIAFNVPSGATNGTTRMRVSMKYNGVPTSCESFQYGEVEDYTINIGTGGGSTACSNAISSFPYSEGFETGFGAWTQAATDDIDWTRLSGATPSAGTGPSTAAQGSNYLYVEASGQGSGYPNAQAILNSPCFDLTNVASATFSFKYHMFGDTDMGSFSLQASSNNGSTWTSVWSKSGNQGDSWLDASVDLSAYTGSALKLRFNRTTGSTWKADIAIDAMSLTSGSADICAGVSEYVSTQNYSTGDRVTYQGSLYERTSTAWVNLGPCGSSGVVNSLVGNEVTTLGTTEVSIYPNPVKGQTLFVKSTNEAMAYHIVNMLGQQVAKGMTSNNRLDVSNLEAGVYLIQLSTVSGIVTKKFLKE